jgi:ribosomal protein L37AE/L43A
MRDVNNNWGHPVGKEKLNKAERIRFKIRYCKECGKKITGSARRTYCIKCRPVYPSDIV